jgi:aryl-alcohol dehydrogenase-like predicted oxidoreductase
MDTAPIQTVSFRSEGPVVTRVGLGGEGILRTFGNTPEARAVIHEALNLGIAYFDSARAYAGSEGYYGTVWPENPHLREKVFQTSKSACRDREGALSDLDNTLKTMGIPYLDLWQIHDVRTEADLKAVSAGGGALEAFLEAKASGKVRHIGVTGHHDPYILARAVTEWPVDSVMMPINPVEGALGGFMDITLPLAREKGVAVIGMKILGAGHYLLPEIRVGADLLLRYALAQEITVAIVGCATPAEVQQLARAGQGASPMSEEEQGDLVAAFRPYARGLAFYRKR